jgi:hypothetical protein
MIDDDQPPSRALYRHGPRLESAAATSRRKQLLPLLAIVLIAVATSCHSNDGGEVTLTAVADPGANAFMPAPATSPPPTSTQPPPTLQPRGDGNTVETLPLPGDRDGLYGGTVNNVEVDRDKIVNFYAANTSQANSFVDTLNSDATIYWSGGTHLTVADVPRYLRELTPAVLRLDTRVTDHGFNGTHSLAKQSVFQAGNVVLVDAHGIPRVRGMSGDPLTAPIPLQGRPKLIGASWSGFHAGALAEARPATTAIGNFVLVDVATDQPFNRPAGTTGTNDTPHTEAVAPPQPAPDASAPHTKDGDSVAGIDGKYLVHFLSTVCGGYAMDRPDEHWTFTHQGGTIQFGKATGPLSPDGSFTATFTGDSNGYSYTNTYRGVFATETGRSVIRNGDWTSEGPAMGPVGCHFTYTATKE